MALVSVIMPAYKVEQYLEQCLKSVIEQDLKDIEIIAIDNGSPDNCGNIIRSFAKRDERIKPIFIEINEGYGHAINAGLEVATGKYIAIVETDDYVEPDMLSTLYYAAEKYGAKVVKGGFTKHFPDGSTLYCKPSCTFYSQEVIVEPLCNNDIFYMESSIWSAIYDREFLLENNIKMHTSTGAAYQDVIFKFMVYTAVDFLVCIDKSVYNYRVFSANSSSKSSQYVYRHFENYEVIREWLIKRRCYETYKHAFYICMVADFKFHYDRLSGEKKDLFCKRAEEYCYKALEEGVDIFHPRFGDKGFEHYYYVDIIPLLEMLTHKKNTQDHSKEEGVTSKQKSRKQINKLPRKLNITFKRLLNKVVFRQEFYSRIKNRLRRLNKTKIFNTFFSKVISILREPFFLNRIIAGTPFGTSFSVISVNSNNGYIELDFPSEKKKILVILPWYYINAVNSNIDALAMLFKDLGYETHLLIYWREYAPDILNQDAWDRVFWKQADNWYFGRSDSNEAVVDGNRVDDWIGDDFLDAVIRLNNHYKYDICMANYLIFTAAFKVLSGPVKKILYTHDRFAKRNSHLKEAGFSEKSFWFSVATEEEEACALNRADIIMAIQEEDGEYFRKITENKRQVVVVPYVPDADFIDFKRVSTRRILEVGYIGGSNPPNVGAIQNVIKQIVAFDGIRLHIAGTVTYALDRSLFGLNIINEGVVDSQKDFYSRCDVVINPDVFYSGLKVKTVEAMSYGAAIVCTKVASTGLPLDKTYHQLKDETACADFLKDLAKMNPNSRNTKIKEMRAESRKKYLLYQKKYPLKTIIKTLCDDQKCLSDTDHNDAAEEH